MTKTTEVEVGAHYAAPIACQNDPHGADKWISASQSSYPCQEAAWDRWEMTSKGGSLSTLTLCASCYMFHRPTWSDVQLRCCAGENATLESMHSLRWQGGSIHAQAVVQKL